MSDINPYASPLHTGDRESIRADLVQATVAEVDPCERWLFRKGSLLVMHKHAVLPDRCVKSNHPSSRRLRRNLAWHHPAIYLALLFAGILIYIILAIVLTKKATIYLGLSAKWHRKRRRNLLIGWGIVLLGLAISVASFILVTEPTLRMAQMGWGIGLGLIMILGGIVYGILSTQMVTAARITDDFVWLKGVHSDFLAELPDWPYHP